jgi:hypothetical protein
MHDVKYFTIVPMYSGKEISDSLLFHCKANASEAKPGSYRPIRGDAEYFMMARDGA